MPVSGYSQIVQTLPVPIKNTLDLQNIQTVDQGIMALLQGIYRSILHQIEMSRIDSVTERSVPVSSVQSNPLIFNPNRLEISIFNASNAQVFVGQTSKTSSTVFLSRLEPGSSCDISGERAKLEIFLISPSAANKSNVSIGEALHDPSKDLYGLEPSAPTPTPPPAAPVPAPASTSTPPPAVVVPAPASTSTPPPAVVVPAPASTSTPPPAAPVPALASTSTPPPAPGTSMSAPQTVRTDNTVISVAANTSIVATLPVGFAGAASTISINDSANGNRLWEGNIIIPPNSQVYLMTSQFSQAGATINNKYFIAFIANDQTIRTPDIALNA